jgi:3-oxoacyl-[acyl-carrier-protein] synthase III
MKTTMTTNAGILSLAVGLPKTIRENSWFKDNFPEEFSRFEEKTLAQVFAPSDKPDAFVDAMAPYLSDPFRGTKRRRVLADGQSQIELERDTALSAIKAAGLEVEDIDMILVAAFPTQHQGIGDGVYIAQALGTRAPAFNVETACSGAIAALQMASALVASGQARKVLVVVSCIYSRACDFKDTLTWFLGDGVGAYVVGRVNDAEGFAAFHAVNTAESCGSFEYRLELDDDDAPRAIIRAGASAGKALRDLTPRAIKDVCGGVLRRANLDAKQIDFFVSNTPLAWFADLFADTMGIDRARTVSTYAEVANIGPALNPLNMHEALVRGLIKPGDTVMLFAIGSVASAAAAIVRLGDVRVGQLVER